MKRSARKQWQTHLTGNGNRYPKRAEQIKVERALKSALEADD
jgi:hypothetical protein